MDAILARIGGTVDTFTVAERSQRMARIRSKDTKPELVVRSALHRLGYRFRLHRRGLPGAPDLVFPNRKKVIFVHGCFWHAHENCTVANLPKSKRRYWSEKFKRNKARDLANANSLREFGWDVLTVWECETKDTAMLVGHLLRFLDPLGVNGLARSDAYGRQ